VTPSLVLAVLLIVPVPAQGPNAGKPSPLKDALTQIVDAVNKEGEIHYTMVARKVRTGETSKEEYVVQTHNATYDEKACSITVEGFMSRDGKEQSKGSAETHLRELSALAVKSQKQLIDERTARAGVSDWKGTVTPDSYGLQMLSNGRMSGILFFHKEETANAVAGHVARATSLCGGPRLLP